MLYFYEDPKIAQARVDALIEEAREGRLVKKTSWKWKRKYRFPNLSNLFANWKFKKNKAVTSQA